MEKKYPRLLLRKRNEIWTTYKINNASDPATQWAVLGQHYFAFDARRSIRRYLLRNGVQLDMYIKKEVDLTLTIDVPRQHEQGGCIWCWPSDVKSNCQATCKCACHNTI